MKGEGLLVVAGEVVEGDPCELADALVFGGDHEFLLHDAFCLLEELDCLLVLDCVGRGVRYLR